ncbi:hypothetical protein C0J52_24352, partial [Blattella germanica]
FQASTQSHSGILLKVSIDQEDECRLIPHNILIEMGKVNIYRTVLYLRLSVRNVCQPHVLLLQHLQCYL